MHLEIITQGLGAWAYLILALLVMIEGPVATLAGAVAAASGLMRPEGVFIAASTGNLTSDCLWYGLGYLGKIAWLERYGHWVGLTPELLNQIKQDLHRHAGRLLLVSKLTLGFSIPTLVATGLSRVSMRRWFPSLLLGETIWTSSLVFLGYHFGRYVQTLGKGLEWVALAGFFLFSILFIVYLAHTRKRIEARQEAASLEHKSAGSLPNRPIKNA